MSCAERLAAVVAVILFAIAGSAADTTPVPFDSDRWKVVAGAVVDHGGRTALAGAAILDDLEFVDGVIEVDVWMDGAPSYPGVVFRLQSMGDTEEVYLRPHRQARYQDSVQYTPRFNGISGWQLYSGHGFTSGFEIPREQWLSLRLEIQGSQARVFVGDDASPDLEVHRLKREPAGGSIGVTGGRVGVAYFSNFRYRTGGSLRFDPPPAEDEAPGVINGWQLSPVMPAGTLDRGRLPSSDALASMAWQPVEAEPSGLVNVARYVSRTGPAPDAVLARTVVRSESDRRVRLLLGYSDRVSVFVNGQVEFDGDSSYRVRDPSFLGIVGPFDAVYVPLKRGDNELILMVTESFGGWGFRCQDGDAVFHDPTIEPSWQSERMLAIPEAVCYDRERGSVYVSNYDGFNPSAGDGRQFLSRLAVDGAVRQREWVTGLNNPTGMAMVDGRLYVVERPGLAEIDPDTAEIIARHLVPQAGFLNDVAADDSGALYVSDSRRHVIFRFLDGRVEEWLSGGAIGSPNGLHVSNGELLVGNNADGQLKAVDLQSKSVRTVARLGDGIIDGIRTDSDGDILVSHWQGRLYRVTRSGEVIKLLDTSVRDWPIADFEYLADHGLIIVPTFIDNRVLAYRMLSK
jgi:sugar lactone lactonase YvrE